MLLLRKSVIISLKLILLPPTLTLLVIRDTLYFLSGLFEGLGDELSSVYKKLGESYEKTL